MDLRPPPQDTEDVSLWLQDLFNYLEKATTFLVGSATWNPGSIADGNEEAKVVTVTGAGLEDFAQASFSLDVTDLALDAQVTASNTVTCVLLNNTGGAIDLGEGTVRVRVVPSL